jgi:hypothetical protein
MTERPRGPLLLLLVGLFAVGCILPPDRVATALETGSEGDGPDPDPGCFGDCPCTGELCEQFCGAPGFVDCDFRCAPEATCLQHCSASPCTSLCEGAETCNLDCIESGGCQMSCFDTQNCNLDCRSGCSSYCENSNCQMTCPEGGCTLHCSGAQSCALLLCPSDCTLICDDVDECIAECIDPGSCTVIINE